MTNSQQRPIDVRGTRQQWDPVLDAIKARLVPRLRSDLDMHHV
eukprot:COSAG01_NODE_29613_length_633_cov_5.994382_1_plen_42_part_01